MACGCGVAASAPAIRIAKQARDQASLAVVTPQCRHPAITVAFRKVARIRWNLGSLCERELNMALVERLGDISKKVVELEGDSRT
jgi:hypothetical protein